MGDLNNNDVCDFNSRIGQNIRKRRNEIHMSMRTLSEKMNLSYETIKSIEKGKTGVSAERMISFSQAMGCTPNYLYGVHDPDDPYDGLDLHDKHVAQDIIRIIVKNKRHTREG